MSFFDDPDDPYSTRTVMGWVRSWKLGKALEAGYNDIEGIKAAIEEMHAAEKAEAEAFWAQMAADGVPVATPEADPGASAEPDVGAGPGAGPEPGAGPGLEADTP
jgi:hypothetical protein